MAQATWNGQVIAQVDDSEIITIEGNKYFPPESVNDEFLEQSDHKTHCHWKGESSYYDIVVDDQRNQAGAWYYPEPMEGSVDRVGKNFANYVAFWNGVEVS
ncbi:TPA: DUF427 domain-containing protein [Candidatus Saccharibacteria bacterium]|jgi:uncharacterized protein (DUF427 family)|nr:DUF427 domain-containing protein [Candidatus Saccharibacteria bacterium]HIO87896.1 DUF427 domain-containing protein [Candidatus Saccharibacteria bacterium]